MRGEIITRDEMLAIPAYEISDLGQIPPNPLVSVIVTTYNHEAYIEQTIEWILAQQCDFPLELIIGEDKSQDRTLSICLDYQRRYPQLIRLVTWHENVGGNENFLRVWGRARGKYVAMCEGDDYWVNPAKLTKQVALMEQFPDTILCGAGAQTLPPNSMLNYLQDMKPQFSTEELIIQRMYFHTSTFFFRSEGFQIPKSARRGLADNVILVIASLQGTVRCIPDTVSVYRLHEKGVYWGIDKVGKIGLQLEWVRTISGFIDERYFWLITKQEDFIRAMLCHALISSGQLTQARGLFKDVFRRLARHQPIIAMVLTFHVCLPRLYHKLSSAWRKRKSLLQ